VLLTPADFTPVLATTNCGVDPNTSPCFGALTVTATGGNIVGAEVEYVNGVSPATLAQSTSLFPLTDASDTIYCTTAKNHFGPATRERITGISVGNAGDLPAAVEVLFTTSLPAASAGQTYKATATIQPGASSVFSAETNTAGGLPAGTLASAKITGPTGSKLVAVVNERNRPTSTAIPVKATTYSCSSAAAATSKVSLPLFKEDFAGRTGITIQNVDSTELTVTASFTCGAPGTVGSYTLKSPTIQPNAGYTFFDVSTMTGGPVDLSFCGVSLDAGGKKIIAVAQTSTDFQSPAGLLNTQNYEGFNLQ
jgi:hypothetical protein